MGKGNKKFLYVLAAIVAIVVVWNVYEAVRPKHNEFVKVGKMSVPRYNHEAVLLDDGSVLIVDGATRETNHEGGSVSAQIYNPKTQKFTSIERMIEPHGISAATATKLNNGKVLIVGGEGKYNRVLSSTELYNPQTKNFEKGTNMNFAREYHTATLLKDGRVLIVGGEGILPTKPRIYNRKTGKFTDVTNKDIPRLRRYSALLLESGKVLITGIEGSLSKSEIYNPKTGKFTIASSLNIPRFKHSAVLLKDGRVLVVGGIGYSNKKFSVLSSAEIFDPKTSKFELVGNMGIARKVANVFVLKNGNVIISGGCDNIKHEWIKEIEEYNPKTNKFKVLTTNKSHTEATTQVLLQDDKILYTGGCTGVSISRECYRETQIYDPMTNKFIKGNSMNYPRVLHRATLLKDGNVLITGSEGTGRTAELFINDYK